VRPRPIQTHMPDRTFVNLTKRKGREDHGHYPPKAKVKETVKEKGREDYGQYPLKETTKSPRIGKGREDYGRYP